MKRRVKNLLFFRDDRSLVRSDYASQINGIKPLINPCPKPKARNQRTKSERLSGVSGHHRAKVYF